MKKRDLIAALSILASALFADGQETAKISIGPLENIKVDAFAQILSDATGRPFAVAGDIDADFTVIVPGTEPVVLPANDVYSFGLSVLASAGLSVVEENGYCRIVRLPEGGGLAVGANGETNAGAHGLVTRVFQLKHAAADDIRKVLEGPGGRKGWIAVLESSNHLVVTDTARTIDRVAKLIDELDQPGLARSTEIVKLQNADADTIAAQLNTVVAQTLQSEGSALSARLQSASGSVNPAAVLRAGVAVPAPHANSLILVGSSAQIDEFKKLIASLDVDSPTGHGNLHSIYLQYIKAEDAAKSISSLLEKSAATTTDSRNVRKVSVEASAANNALLVEASPTDFAVVKKLVESLDVMPGQVHVSVMIAEVTDGRGFTWSSALSAIETPAKSGDTTISGGSRMVADGSSLIENAASGVFPQGLTAAIMHNSDGNLSYPGIVSIEALKSDSGVKILSETSLQAQNNIEADVSIVDEIPILKSTIEGGSGSSRDVIQNIDRQEVGVKLKFTPHIVPGALVRMELNPSIESVIATTGGDAYTPTIAKRSATTTVTVPDGDTIVIAGLTKTSVQKVETRIPILGDIPLLGWLFRYKHDSEEKTNLLIFVTPTVIANPADAKATTSAWRAKTGITEDAEKPTEK